MLTFATLRRHRHGLGRLCLASWLFVLGVGVAYACSWHGEAHQDRASATARVPGDSIPPGCEEACNDQPVVTKLQAVQDVPAGQPLGALPVALVHRAPSAPSRVASDPHPPPGLTVSIGFPRLHL
jgi:hypothetical protein